MAFTLEKYLACLNMHLNLEKDKGHQDLNECSCSLSSTLRNDQERIFKMNETKEELDNCFTRSDFKGGTDHHACEDSDCTCKCDFCFALSLEERRGRKETIAKRERDDYERPMTEKELDQADAIYKNGGLTPEGNRNNLDVVNEREIVKSEIIGFFNAVLTKSPKEILAYLFCTPPDKLFHEMSNDEKQDFLHFYQEVERKSKIISQSATIAYQQFELDIAGEERERLGKRDREYKAKPLETKIKVNSEDRLKSKIAKDLESLGLSAEDIIAILNKKA